MTTENSKRASDEERAERAARDLKSELNRAKALVAEARRRLERGVSQPFWRGRS